MVGMDVGSFNAKKAETINHAFTFMFFEFPNVLTPFCTRLVCMCYPRSLCFQCVLIVLPIIVAKVQLFISLYSEFMNFKKFCCDCCFWCAQRTILLFFFVVHLWASNLLMLGTFVNFGTKGAP